MTDQDNSDAKGPLDEQLLGLLGAAQSAADAEVFSAEHQARLQARIMARLDAEQRAQASGWVTVRASDGPWQQLAPKIEKKVLQINEENATETYLLRVEPGAKAPPHRHTSDEICIMLDGEVRYGDFYLRAGDYHFAPKDSIHGEAHSEKGALLFIHAGINSQAAV